MADDEAARDAGGEDEEADGTAPKYSIPARSTRGKRMGELVGDALEADQDFWGQTAWQELSDDDDIQSDEWSTDEKGDEEDSDIDDVDEDAEERDRAAQAVDLEQQEKRRLKSERNKRKKGVYVDPALKAPAARKAKRARSAGSSEGAGARGSSSVVAPSSRQVRKSTKVSTISTNAAVMQDRRNQRERHAAKRPREPLLRLTQQQLLEEAARTEVENKRSLELMLMLQEERRRDRTKVDKQSTRRVIYFSSQRGVRRDASGAALDPLRQSLTFTHVSSVPAVINAKAPSPPAKAICSVTGLPAKYRDPASGIPFRTVEAFKVLRGIKSPQAGEAAGSSKAHHVAA